MGYVSSLLQQMEDAKRRMGGPLAPSADAFNVAPPPPGVPQGQPMAPPLAPPMSPPAFPVAADPMANVANANISDLSDPTHGHQRGLKGGLLHLFGADRIQPEVAALLTPDQQRRVKPGLLGTIGNFLNEGVGPQTMMERRADKMLKRVDEKTKRDKSAALARLQAAWTPAIFAARTPEEIHQAQVGYANARAAILGPEDMGTTPNFLGVLKPDKDVLTPVEKSKLRPSNDYTVGGRRIPVKVNDTTGDVYGMDNQPIDPATLGIYEPPTKPDKPDRLSRQFVWIDQPDGTRVGKWVTEGDEVTAAAPIAKDIKVINNERSLAYDDAQLSIRGLTDEKGEVKNPPSSWDRVATQSNWTNWAATGEGQAYMNNTRKLIRAWVVLIEGKRMSDADAAVNEAMRSFRPGDKEAVVDGKKQTLKSMAESIGKLGGKKGALLPDPTAKTDAAAEPSEEDLVRAYKALGTRATDAEVDEWIAKNPRKP